jgi:hypothetical protein
MLCINLQAELSALHHTLCQQDRRVVGARNLVWKKQYLSIQSTRAYHCVSMTLTMAKMRVSGLLLLVLAGSVLVGSFAAYNEDFVHA